MREPTFAQLTQLAHTIARRVGRLLEREGLLERDTEQLDLGVTHGERLRELAPGFAHARHMLGHNLGRVGRMEEALEEFEVADQIELRLDWEEGVRVKHDWHHGHNLGFLVLVNYYLGHFEAAERSLARYQTQAGYISSPMMDNMHIEFELGYRMGHGQWEALPGLVKRAEGLDTPESRAMGSYINAIYMLARNRIDEAARWVQKGQEQLNGGGLHGMLSPVRDVPKAMVELDKGDQDPLESLMGDLADDSNPHSWIRAHWYLDGIIQLASISDQEDAARLALSTLSDHDPYYQRHRPESNRDGARAQ